MNKVVERRQTRVPEIEASCLEIARPESARLWLRSPNPELAYEKPIDLIGQGEYRRVIGALLAMVEGVTS